MIPSHKPFSDEARGWDWREIPNGIAAITKNHLLKETLSFEWGALPGRENIERELALAVVFTGKPQLLRGCPEKLEFASPKMFFNQWISDQLTRIATCAEQKTVIETFTACDAVKTYRVDYVVWESSFELEIPDFYQHTMYPLWQSDDN